MTPPTPTTTERPGIEQRRGRTTGQWTALVLGVVALLVAGLLVAGDLGGPDLVSPAVAPVGADDDAAQQDTSAAADGETTEVSMTEFAFAPASLQLDAGTHTLRITNDGAAPHQWALSAVGEHGAHGADTGELDPGETATLTVDLEPGVYEFACHVAGHYEAGMHGRLEVAGPDGTVPGAPAGDAADEAGHDDAPAPEPDHDDAAGEPGHDEAPESEAGHHHDAAAEADGATADGQAAADAVEVSMTEFAYQPSDLELPAGTHTFVITNDGEVPHEWALATAGEHHGHGASTRQLAPGETQRLTVELEPGEYGYMCHISGHLEAGMEGTLTVTR